MTLSAPDPSSIARSINGLDVGTISIPPVNARADGTFEVAGILPGAYRFSAGAPGGWWARSAMANGRDLFDVPPEFGQSGDVTGVVVTFTDRHSDLSGALQTASGAAAPDYFVVALPADRALWQPNARRIRSTRPATDGHFSFTDLPGGEYLLAALSDFEPSDLNDEKFLEQLAPAAIKVTIVDGQKTTQDLRIARH